jgi:hypothetical protein
MKLVYDMGTQNFVLTDPHFLDLGIKAFNLPPKVKMAIRRIKKQVRRNAEKRGDFVQLNQRRPVDRMIVTPDQCEPVFYHFLRGGKCSPR